MHPILFLKRLSRGFATVGQVWGLPEKWAKVRTKFAEYPQALQRVFNYVFGAVVGIMILLIALRWLLPDDSLTKYAIAYWISPDQVTVDPKPHNCEWGSAPLGDKHCHYRAVVVEERTQGTVRAVARVHVEWERIQE